MESKGEKAKERGRKKLEHDMRKKKKKKKKRERKEEREPKPTSRREHNWMAKDPDLCYEG